MMQPDPPERALKLLRAVLDADAAEAIGGDLEEQFRARVTAGGRAGARAWFWRQTFRSIIDRRRLLRAAAAEPPQRPASFRNFLEQRARDLRFAARQLAASPGFTAVAVMALALGIGLTTTTFSIVRGSLLRGLPFDRAEELVHFERQNVDSGQLSMAVSPHDFVDWRAQQTSFVDLGAYTDVLVIVGGEEVAAESHLAILIDWVSFDLLGVSPALGRPFGPADEQPGAPPVILIGDGYWRTRLGGDPGVIGRSIRIDGTATTIVGVMPPGFAFPVEEQLWMPLQLDFTRIPRGGGRLDAFGRLLRHKTIDDARAEFGIISRNLQQAYPDSNAGIAAVLQSFEEEYIGEEFTSMMFAMLAGALLVLGIACANVANLQAARTVQRGREMAVRTAIGAGGRRIFAQLLTESTLLTAIGGIAGLGVAWLGVAAFRAAWARGVPIGLPHGLSNGLFWWQFEIDGGVLVFVVGITLLTSVVAGTAPALRAARAHPWIGLQTTRGAGGSRAGRSSRLLVIAQFALTAGLLATAGLMVKSVYHTATIDDGIPSDEVFTARVELLAAAGDLPDNYPDVPSRLRFWDDLGQRLAADSRAVAVGMTTSLPMSGAGRASVLVEGSAPEGPIEPSAVVVTPGFFDVFDVEPLEGRLLRADDRPGTEPVVVVNTSFARQAFESAAPVGRRLRLGGDDPDAAEPWLTVVGVVPDLFVDGERSAPAIYLPLRQGIASASRRSIDRWDLRRLSVAVRTEGSPRALANGLRNTVADMDRYVPVGDMQPMRDLVAGFTAQYRVYGAFYVVFGAVALIMATIGLYSIVAHSVGNRTAEIGVRMAMGADAASVLKLVVSQGLLQIALGILAGTAIAIWLPYQVTGILFEVEPWDPWVLVGVVALLVATGVAACWTPALRAARVDPLEAMRGG